MADRHEKENPMSKDKTDQESGSRSSACYLDFERMLFDNRRKEKRARAVEMLALQMVFGEGKKIVIASPSKQDAAALFDEAKQRASELIELSR